MPRHFATIRGLSSSTKEEIPPMPIAIEFFVGHAYAILFLWVLVEQFGLPVPSIPLLLTAGTLSATHRVSFTTGLLAVVAACLISDSSWYALGRRYGNRVIRLLCKLSLESSICVAKTDGYLVRRGAETLLFAKFVPGLSTVARSEERRVGKECR